jgi:hypothetical protein
MQPSDLIVCGWDEVFILDGAKLAEGKIIKTWRWTAETCPNLPADLRSAFRTTDECKPVDGGRRILVTSSGGGIALIDRTDNRALFHAFAENAHSADMLPGNRLAVAVSMSDNGNRISLYDLDKPGVELSSVPLAWAHGAVWDAQRTVLWTLGESELLECTLTDWDSAKTSLTVKARHELPDAPAAGGHDLSAVPNSPLLLITTAKHCWQFDRNQRAFAPYAPLTDKKGIKCVSIDPASGRVAYQQAEGKDWWGQTIHFLQPDAKFALPGEHVYKLRWLPRYAEAPATPPPVHPTGNDHREERPRLPHERKS